MVQDLRHRLSVLAFAYVLVGRKSSKQICGENFAAALRQLFQPLHSSQAIKELRCAAALLCATRMTRLSNGQGF